MFYVIKNDGKEEISLEDIDPLDQNMVMGYLNFDEFEESYRQFGFYESTIEECKMQRESIRSSIDVYDEFSFGIVTVIEPTAIQEQMDKVAFYIKKNLFLLVKLKDDNESVLEVFNSALSKFKQNITLEKLIYGFFEKLIYGDNRILESIGKRITTMEENMMNQEPDHFVNKQIFTFKKELLVFKDYYEQLIDIGEELLENENDLFIEDDLRYFKLFTDKVIRLRENVESLTEMTVHLREAYEASLDISLNTIMKVFTVVTTVFLPLSLIVGWYGMNFQNMPELTWKYGYICIVAVSISVVIGCLFFFKKKKFI